MQEAQLRLIRDGEAMTIDSSLSLADSDDGENNDNEDTEE